MQLATWDNRSTFSYEGSVEKGTTIKYGKKLKYEIHITSDQYKELLSTFEEKSVPMGTSRDNPPIDSVGKWLIDNVSKTAIASYIGAILVYEGYAIKAGSIITLSNTNSDK